MWTEAQSLTQLCSQNHMAHSAQDILETHCPSPWTMWPSHHWKRKDRVAIEIDPMAIGKTTGQLVMPWGTLITKLTTGLAPTTIRPGMKKEGFPSALRKRRNHSTVHSVGLLHSWSWAGSLVWSPPLGVQRSLPIHLVCSRSLSVVSTVQMAFLGPKCRGCSSQLWIWLHWRRLPLIYSHSPLIWPKACYAFCFHSASHLSFYVINRALGRQRSRVERTWAWNEE